MLVKTQKYTQRQTQAYNSMGYVEIEGPDFINIYLNPHTRILSVCYHGDQDIDKSKAYQIIKYTKPIFKSYADFGISDARATGLNISKEANAIFKSYPSYREAYGLAILVNNLPIRILANFFINVNKPVIPTRSFQDINKATAWLLKLGN